MATLDAELRQVALALIDELGCLYTFTVPGLKSYNPGTGETTEVSPEEFPIKGSPPQRRKGFVPGDILPEGSLYFYVAAKDIPTIPALGYSVTLDNVTYKITVVDSIYSGFEVCVYGIQIHV